MPRSPFAAFLLALSRGTVRRPFPVPSVALVCALPACARARAPRATSTLLICRGVAASVLRDRALGSAVAAPSLPAPPLHAAAFGGNLRLPLSHVRPQLCPAHPAPSVRPALHTLVLPALALVRGTPPDAPGTWWSPSPAWVPCRSSASSCGAGCVSSPGGLRHSCAREAWWLLQAKGPTFFFEESFGKLEGWCPFSRTCEA